MRQICAIPPEDTHTDRCDPWATRCDIVSQSASPCGASSASFLRTEEPHQSPASTSTNKSSRPTPPRTSQPEPSGTWSSMTTCLP